MKRRSVLPSLAAAATLCLVGKQPLAGARTTDASALRPVRYSELRVTEGKIESLPSGSFSISHPKVRAVLANPSSRSAELRFRLLGKSDTTAPLSDGEARAQLGLKLRAQDGCNVIYVMWRIEPKSVLAVHMKQNAGQWLSSQCGARGYHALSSAVPLPRPEVGAAHSLRADLEANQLVVRVDGEVAWQGSVGEEPPPFSGPVGLRTDNVRVEFELSATGSVAP